MLVAGKGKNKRRLQQTVDCPVLRWVLEFLVKTKFKRRETQCKEEEDFFFMVLEKSSVSQTSKGTEMGELDCGQAIDLCSSAHDPCALPPPLPPVAAPQPPRKSLPKYQAIHPARKGKVGERPSKVTFPFLGIRKGGMEAPTVPYAFEFCKLLLNILQALMPKHITNK